MVTTLPRTVRSYQNLIKIKFLVCLQIKNMPLAIDASKDEPSLADMQQSALSKLERNKKVSF